MNSTERLYCVCLVVDKKQEKQLILSYRGDLQSRALFTFIVSNSFI